MVSWRINSTKLSNKEKLNKMKKSNEQAETKPCTIHGVMSSALTENEIKIAQIQSAIKKYGYQWQEHQFNDGFDEVYIEIAKDTDVSTFDRH